MAELHLALENKEEALSKLQIVVQEINEAKKWVISTIEVNTITKTNMVNSSCVYLSKEHLGDFQKHTRGIGSTTLT